MKYSQELSPLRITYLAIAFFGITFYSSLNTIPDVSAASARPSVHIEVPLREKQKDSQRERTSFSPSNQLHEFYIEQSYKDNAPKHFDNLRQTTKAKARNWINNLTNGELAKLIEGLALNQRIDIKTSPSSDQATLEQLVEQYIYQDLRVSRRDSFLNMIMSEIDKTNRNDLSEISEANRNMLFDFAKERGSKASKVEQIDIDLVDKWYESITKEQDKLLATFPILYNTRETDRPALDFSTAINNISESNTRRLALHEYLDKNTDLQKLGIADWKIKTNTAEEVWNTLHILASPLPGDRPNIVLFMDPTYSGKTISEISKASKTNLGKPKILDHTDIQRFLSGYEGKTVIVIGHMENSHIVLRKDNATSLKIHIPTLIEKAAKQNTLLLPLGCNSATEGAYFGFLRPILASEIATSIKMIPSRAINIGEFLNAFNNIGSISLDATDIAQHLTFVIQRSSPQEQKERITAAWIPTFNAAPTQSFSNYYNSLGIIEQSPPPPPSLPRLPSLPSPPPPPPVNTSAISTFFATLTGAILSFPAVPYFRNKLMRRRELLTKIPLMMIFGVVLTTATIFASWMFSIILNIPLTITLALLLCLALPINTGTIKTYKGKRK